MDRLDVVGRRPSPEREADAETIAARVVGDTSQAKPAGMQSSPGAATHRMPQGGGAVSQELRAART